MAEHLVNGIWSMIFLLTKYFRTTIKKLFKKLFVFFYQIKRSSGQMRTSNIWLDRQNYFQSLQPHSTTDVDFFQCSTLGYSNINHIYILSLIKIYPQQWKRRPLHILFIQPHITQNVIIFLKKKQKKKKKKIVKPLIKS